MWAVPLNRPGCNLATSFWPSTAPPCVGRRMRSARSPSTSRARELRSTACAASANSTSMRKSANVPATTSPGITITVGLLGLGADGHTASLFNTTHLEQARGKLAIAVQRPDGLQAVSVTPDLLSKVAEPLFLVTGADKHAIVEEFLKSDSRL